MAVAQVLTQFENLPQDVKDKLAELDLELSEGRMLVYLIRGNDLTRLITL